MQLRLLKSTFYAKNFGCNLSWSTSVISPHFTLEMCQSLKLQKKSLKPLTLTVECHQCRYSWKDCQQCLLW